MRHAFNLSRGALLAALAVAASACSGSKGDAGTANVIYSDWFTPSTYQSDTIFGEKVFWWDQAAPQLTQGILDTGTVLVFGKLNGYNSTVWPTNQVAMLPITVDYVTGTFMWDVWEAVLKPGNVRITFQNSQNYYSAISNSHSFRYVIVPGGVSAAAVMASSLDELSYADLCARLAIPE